MKDIVVPTVAESVTSGVIARWNKAEGQFAAVDDVIFELETDKVTMEVRAEVAGVVAKHLVPAGETVKVGQVVGKLDETAKGAAPAAAAPAAKAPAAAAAPVVREPVQAAASGAPSAGAMQAAASAAASVGGGQDESRATPLARKMAEEFRVDLARVVGTGPGGRVREQDVLALVQSHASGNGSAGHAAPAAGGGHSRNASRERMTPLRARIAERLVHAKQTTAMLTTFNEVDMSAIMALRGAHKEEFEKKHGVGLGFMSFFVKAAVHALKQFPIVNAWITEGPDGEPMIERHDYYDISVAVSTPKGLTVPVIRNADKLSFAQVENTIKDLATRARDGKLSLDELQGGTFTVTNGGIFGSLMSTPILNFPQTAILGMHAIKNRPVEDPKNPGQIVLRPMMYLAMSYDHRLIDGAESVRFLVAIKQAIEDPARLLIEI